MVVVAIRETTASGPSREATQAEAPQPWPEITATLKEEFYDDGQLSRSRRLRLTMLGPTDWRVEIAGDTRDDIAMNVGHWGEFKDGILSSYDPMLGKTTSRPVEPGAVYQPNEWFWPVNLEALRARGFQEVASGDGRITVRSAVQVQTGTPPCPVPDHPACENDASAESGSTRTLVETRVYRADYMIPVEIRKEVDGRLKERITVEELTLGDPVPAWAEQQ